MILSGGYMDGGRGGALAQAGGFIPAAAGAWAPPSGCELWVAGTGISGLADGDPVSSWPDMSGHGRDVLQATAGKRPLYKTNVKNGKPGVLFDGVDDFLQVAFGTTIAQPTSWYAVLQVSDTSANRYAFDGLNNEQVITATGGTWLAYAGAAFSTAADTSWHLLGANFNGGSSAIVIDGGTAHTGNAGTQGLTGVTLGNFGRNDLSECPWAGYIAEVLLFSSVLGTSDDASVTGYLQTKYAL